MLSCESLPQWSKNIVGQENMRSGNGQELSESRNPRKADTSEVLGNFRYLEPEILGDFRYVEKCFHTSSLHHPAAVCAFSD